MKQKWTATVKQFLGEVVSEGKKVSWPVGKQLFGSTLVVIITVLSMTVFIALIDFIFSKLINLIVR